MLYSTAQANCAQGVDHMLNHILLPLDGSVLAEKVLPHAFALADTFNSKLSLLRVVYPEGFDDHHGMINPMDWQMRKSEAESYLQSIQTNLEDEGIETDIQVLEGRPAQQIIEFSRQSDVNLIILSSHGSSGISEWNINSTVQKVLLRAFIPVMIVRAYQDQQEELKGLKYKKLLVPLDGSKRAECALSLADSISRKQESKLLLAHVVEEPHIPRQTPMTDEDRQMIEKINAVNQSEAEKYIESVQNQLLTDNSITHIESSPKPAASLHEMIEKEKVDLVILSAHGLSGDNKWPYGTIALNFIVYGTTPLIIFQDLSKDDIEKSLAEQCTEQSKGH